MDYARLTATAQRLINKAGRSVTWRQFGDPVAQDPNQPWIAAPDATPTDFPGTYVAFLPVGTANPFLVGMKAALDVPAGSVSALVAGNPLFVPTLTDVCITTDELGVVETLRVIKLETIRPSDQSVLHTMVLCR